MKTKIHHIKVILIVLFSMHIFICSTYFIIKYSSKSLFTLFTYYNTTLIRFTNKNRLASFCAYKLEKDDITSSKENVT